MGRGRRACRRGFPVSTGGFFFFSFIAEGRAESSHPPQVGGWLSYQGGHMVTLTTCPPLTGILTLLLRHKIKKKKKMTNKNETEESRQQVAAFRPGSCMCPSPRPLAPDTPSLSGYQCISVQREIKSQTNATIIVRLTSCLWGLILKTAAHCRLIKHRTNQCICVGLLSAAD